MIARCATAAAVARAAILLIACGATGAARGEELPPAAPDAPAIAAIRQEMEALRRDYEQRLQDLEARLAELETTASAPPAPAPQPATPVGAGAQTSSYFNPAISVIGNFLAVGGSNQVENLPSAELRESELGLQAIIDPYARADVFLSIGEEGIGVEEGFATFTSLPGQLLAKVGRMRASFGKVNTLHLHTMPWPDKPLPVVNLLGGEEGWIGTGISVGRLIPLPADTFSELTLQVFRGDSGDLFAVQKRSDLAWNGHYRLFRDLSEAVNLDLGLSYGYGPSAIAPGTHTNLQALDTTLRWKPLDQAGYHAFTFRGELMRSATTLPLLGADTAWGWFASGEYRLAQRWRLGARLESADRPAEPGLTDRGYALLLGFSPSEFSMLRGELRRRDYDLGPTADELLLQLQFAIGAHGAHPF